MSKKISTATLRSLMKNEIEPMSTVLKVGDMEIQVEVKQYLPIEKKMVMIQQIVNSAFVMDEETNVKKYNNVLADVSLSVLVIQNYTNISLVEDITEMYDIIVSTGILSQVMQLIPQSEMEFIQRQTSALLQEEQHSFEKENNVGLVLKKIFASFNNDTSEMIETLKEFDGDKMASLKQLIDAAQSQGIIGEKKEGE